MILIVLLLIFGAANAAAAPSPQYFEIGGNKYFAVADAYARSASLKPLRPSGAVEVRTWDVGVMSGDGTGFVVSRATRREFRLRTNYLENTFETKIFPSKLIGSTSFRSSLELQQALSEVANFDGESLGCDVADGGVVLVDAAIGGKRITLYASNPDWCKDAGSIAVTTLLRIVREQKQKSTETQK